MGLLDVFKKSDEEIRREEFDKEQAQLAFEREKEKKELAHQNALNDMRDKQRVRDLKRKRKNKYIEAEFEGEDVEDILSRRTLKMKWLIFRSCHIGGAVTSWILSASYWLLLLLLSSSVLSGYGFSETFVSIYFALGIIGGMLLITILEMTKFSAQEEQLLPVGLILYLVAISLATTTGKFMNDSRGAEEARAARSQSSVSAQNVASKNEKIFADNRWAVVNYPDANTVEAVRALRDKYMKSYAINNNGVRAGFTNEYAFAKRMSSYVNTIESRITSFDKRIDALKKYYSVVDLVDNNGVSTIKTGGTGSGNGDAFIEAISKYVDWEITTTTLLFYLFVSIALELSGRFNGQRSRVYKMKLDGFENVLKREALAESLALTPDMFEAFLARAGGQQVQNPQLSQYHQQAVDGIGYQSVQAQPVQAQPAQSVQAQAQAQVVEAMQVPPVPDQPGIQPEQQDNWRPFYFKNDLCLTPQSWEEVKRNFGAGVGHIGQAQFSKKISGYPVFYFGLEYNGITLDEFFSGAEVEVAEGEIADDEIARAKEESKKLEAQQEKARQRKINRMLKLHMLAKKANSGDPHLCPFCEKQLEKQHSRIFCTNQSNTHEDGSCCSVDYYNFIDPARQEFVKKHKKNSS